MTTTNPSTNPSTIPSAIPATRTRLLRAVAPPLALVLGLSLAACGEDDDADAAGDDPAPTTSTVSEPPATDPPASDPPATDPPASGASPEFCDAFVGVDMAFQQAPADDAEAIGPYVEVEILPRLEAIRANLPGDVADEVSVMADAVEAVATTGDFSAMESPEFASAQATVYPWLGGGCDLPVVEVAAVDYGFDGVPTELEPGPTVFTLVNESAAGEAHEMSFARVRDGVDLSVDELLALPMEELEQHVEIGGGTYAPAGASGSAIIPLTEGRWVYVCFIPIGSVHGEEGSGPPHIAEGMVGELTVG